MTNLELVGALATQPRKAFEALDVKPRFWFPLLLTLALVVGLTIWYYQVADLGWVMDEQLRANPRLTEAQRAQAAQLMTPGVLMGSSTVAAVLIVVLIHALVSGYYLLAGKIVNLQRSFRHWFALSTWSSLPTLLAYVPAAVVLLTTSNGQIDQSALQPLSLNELFFHRTLGQPGYTLLITLNLLLPLAWLLAIIAVKTWSKRSWLYSTVFALLPSLLIYGIWGWISLT